jgi:PAS domain S-box-containing protein
MFSKFLALFKYDASRVKLFQRPEENYFRDVVIQAVFAFLVAPLFAYLMYRLNAPMGYIYGALLFTSLFLVSSIFYLAFYKFRPFFRYVFIIEILVFTVLGYLHLRNVGFQHEYLIFYTVLVVLSSAVIQELYPAIVYQLGVLLSLLADHKLLDEAETPPVLIVGVFLMLGITHISLLYFRRQQRLSAKEYVSYLQQVMNNPGTGFILIRQTDIHIIDHNEEVLRLFSVSESGLNELFSGFFNNNELRTLHDLKPGHKYKKQVGLTHHNARYYVDIRFSTFHIQNRTYLLATVANVTDEVLKREELQLKEKRYRNLYFRNKAGVFTLNTRAQVIEANDTFYSMFDNTLSKGDSLFKKDNYNEWSLIVDSLKSSEKVQSYQTQYRLDNGTQKTFVFSWYIDSKTTYIEGSVIDLTRIEQANQALKESEEKYRLIYEESNDAILLLDGDRIVDANRRTEEMFGVPREAILKKKLFDFSYQTTTSEAKRYQHQKEQLSSSRTIRFNWLFQGKDDIVEAEVSLVEIIIGDKLFYQCVIHDTTEQNKLAKEQLRAELAEETNIKLEEEIKERIKAETRLQEQFLRTRAIFESSSNTLLLTTTPAGEITFFNSHCDNYFRNTFKLHLKKERNFLDYLDGIVSKRQRRMLGIIFSSVRKGASRQFEVRLQRSGRDYWLELFINPIFDTEGKVGEISMVAHDITEKKRSSIGIEESLKEKEVLLKEIHHRVKNNLQIISSILNLQTSFVTDENTLAILQESRNRIRSMAIIHENLYRTEDFSSIQFNTYLKNLATSLVSSYSIEGAVSLDMDLQEVDLVLDQAIPCGLLINELITNALKYAWDKQTDHRVISIALKQKKSIVILTISDNGIGLPDDFENIQTETLGLQLVATLAEQLEARLKVQNQNGTKFEISFKNTKT